MAEHAVHKVLRDILGRRWKPPQAPQHQQHAWTSNDFEAALDRVGNAERLIECGVPGCRSDAFMERRDGGRARIAPQKTEDHRWVPGRPSLVKAMCRG